MRRRFDNLSSITATLVVLLILSTTVSAAYTNNNIFNVLGTGTSSSYALDNTKALLKTWELACKWSGNEQAIVYIPPARGIYLIHPVILNGPCTGPIIFRNEGKIMGPPGPIPKELISFRYIDGLTVNGGGSFDGQGSTVWGRNSLHSDVALLDFSFIKNSNIESISLTNSKKTHLHLYASHFLHLHHITISSPSTSPNTDGIKIAESTNIKITDTTIHSGDDCIAMLTGSRNITITNIDCGPGHGVSIGSMGGSPNEKVMDITVNNVNFTDTLNGVRIKTWVSMNQGFISRVWFKDIIMKGVHNPVVIDQNYCPTQTCQKGNSRVQIQDVKFINIKGTSKKKVVIKLDCSGTYPCKDIILQNIDLSYIGQKKGSAVTQCSNVLGMSLGPQNPTPCI